MARAKRYERQALKVGDLAYYDSLSLGPIPCSVLCVSAEPHVRPGRYRACSDVSFEVQLTAGRRGIAGTGIFSKGQRLWCCSLHVFPRKALRGNRIMPYDVIVPEVAQS